MSCTTDEGLEIKTIRDFDIYASDTLNNAFVFDMVPTSSGFMIVSICGTSRLANKFGGDGRLYLLEVDNFGNVLWEDICKTGLFESGYPSNLIKESEPDRFTLLWNEFNGALKSITLAPGFSPDSSSIQALNCNGCKADKAIPFNDKIFSVGLIDDNGSANTVIYELDPAGPESRLLSEKPFDASKLGGFGLNDLNFVNRINNFIHLKSNGLRLLFTGPSESRMILSHVGEILPEFGAGNLWVADLINNPGSPEHFALTLQNPANPQDLTTFIPDIDLSGLPGKSGLQDLTNQATYRFQNLDPDLPQFILNYDTQKWVIVGTSINGLPTVISLNTATNEIVRTELGDNTRFDIAKAELKLGDLYVTGTTVVNGRFQRPFLLRISREDIF